MKRRCLDVFGLASWSNSVFLPLEAPDRSVHRLTLLSGFLTHRRGSRTKGQPVLQTAQALARTSKHVQHSVSYLVYPPPPPPPPPPPKKKKKERKTQKAVLEDPTNKQLYIYIYMYIYISLGGDPQPKSDHPSLRRNIPRAAFPGACGSGAPGAAQQRPTAQQLLRGGLLKKAAPDRPFLGSDWCHGQGMSSLKGMDSRGMVGLFARNGMNRSGIPE